MPGWLCLTYGGMVLVGNTIYYRHNYIYGDSNKGYQDDEHARVVPLELFNQCPRISRHFPAPFV